MGDEPDRDSALLTTTQRDYLRGNYDGKQNSKDKLRGRMRDRIRHSIHDFTLLDTALTEADRTALFETIAGNDGGGGYIHPESGVETDTVDNLDLIDGLHHALGFIYTATQDAGIEFDSFLETAIRQSLDMDPTRYEVRAETAVKRLPPEPDVDTAMERMQNDLPLTDAEFRVLITEGPFDPGRVIEYYESQQKEEPKTVEWSTEELAEVLPDDLARDTDDGERSDEYPRSEPDWSDDDGENSPDAGAE